MNEEQRKQQSQIKKDYSEYFTAPSLKSAKSRGKEDIQYHDDFTVNEELKGMGEGRKYYIRTYGCQMNEHDTEVMAGIFAELGYEKTDDWREANVALLNTCAVRENAENKVFGEIGHLKSHKKNNPDFIIGLCGCMSQEESVVKFVMEKHPQVDFIFGTHNIHRLPEILKEAYMSKATVVEVWSKEGDIIESMPKIREGSIKAWVNIMYGCDKFCTYCIVPYTRGKERSRRPEDIIEEVRELAKAGYQEVTLLGQNVNAYGNDLDESMDLGDLLAEIKKIGIPRIRFTTSHPWDFTDNLIETIASGGNIMDYIHLPVQSGSSQILKLMGRNYTRASYLELVGKIKAAIPEVALTTDIIVGFPNETDEQFEETLTLYKEVEYDIAYTFIYSPREGTPAAKMEDNIPMEVKKERLKRLNVVVNEIALKKNQAFEGKVEKVLVEGTSAKDDSMLAGYTSKQKLVNFKGSEEFIGKIVDVKITKAKTWSLDGEMV